MLNQDIKTVVTSNHHSIAENNSNNDVDVEQGMKLELLLSNTIS